MKLLAYFFIATVALVGACAKTVTDTNTDGQTHWMIRCDETSDCGALECICGVCTETCSGDDDCSVQGDGAAVCAVASDALDPTACERGSATQRACLPVCEQQRDCDEVGEGLACTSEGACGLMTSREPGDGGSGGDGGIVAEPDSSDAPIKLSCPEDGVPNGSDDHQVLVARDSLVDPIAVAPDGTVYVATTDGRTATLLRVDASGSSPFSAVADIRRILVDGDDVIVATELSALTILAIDRATEAVTTLGSAPSLVGSTMTIDGNYVYWSGFGTEGTGYKGQVWRSPRVPGNSELIGEFPGTLENDTLQVIGENVYLIVGSGDDADKVRVFRGAKDGSTGLAPAAGKIDLAVEMTGDGTDLFLTLNGPNRLDQEPADARGIGRMDPSTLEIELLFDTGSRQPHDLTLSGDYLYWTIYDPEDEQHPERVASVWRGRKDGSSAPEALAQLVNDFPRWLQVSGANAYWLDWCGSTLTPVSLSTIALP